MILILICIKKSQPILFDINLSQLYLTYQTNNRHIIQKYPQNMFFFKSCCSGTNNTDAFGSQNAYRVVSKNQKQQQNVRYFQSYDQIDKKCFASPYFHVLKIQKSKYEEQIKSLSGSDLQWIDNQFEPDQKSLGNIPNVNNGRWLRLANILNKPALFDGKIQPKDIVQQSADCYFLSAVAALAQNQQHIRNIFGNQKYNKNGIYVVTLRINGIIKQILVDDFVPANNKGQPLFSKPNKNQFWLPILEKAWAKANRSYENIISGNPGQIFKAVTYAPSIAYSIKQNQQQCEKIWKQIISSRKQNRPCCCQTDEEADESWQKLGLMAGQGYTIIQAEQLIGKGQKAHRMLILRNVHNKLEWTGQGNERDEQFWNKIKNTKQKQKFIKNKNKMHDGIMFINYNDFCKYFSMVYFSLYQKGAHYFSEQFIPDADIATCFLFKVDKKGNYILQLHQPADHNKYKSSLDEEEYVNRSTLILARRLIDNTKQKQDINDQDFQFINGIMKYSQTDTTLSVELQPGDYLIYTKIDPLRKSNQMPETASLSVYTKQLINLNQIQLDKNAQARILHKMFLNHAKLNKRQTHNDEKMWISWKLLFQQGGFAYIAFGNSEDSDKKFIVTLHQNDFDEMKFQLIERPLQKQKVLIVQPNEELIILSKVKNQIFKGIKFPPQMQIKLEKVHHP